MILCIEAMLLSVN
jgi:NADH-quinone oxidoreductase subunit K